MIGPSAAERKAIAARRPVTTPRWRGPTSDPYPESVPGLDLNDPDGSFEDVLDRTDEMSPTMASRTIGQAYAQAEAGYGCETRAALAVGTLDARASTKGLGKIVSLVAGHMLRAAKYKVESTLTVEQWIEIRGSHENTCAYCGERTRRLTLDHVAPLSRGGANSEDNIVACCRRCNSRKSARAFSEWMTADGMNVAAAEQRIARARAKRGVR